MVEASTEENATNSAYTTLNIAPVDKSAALGLFR